MPTPPPLTLRQKIAKLIWFDHIEKLREILDGILSRAESSIAYIGAGTNVTITGTGLSEDDPMIINATGGGGGGGFIPLSGTVNGSPVTGQIKTTALSALVSEEGMFIGSNRNSDLEDFSATRAFTTYFAEPTNAQTILEATLAGSDGSRIYVNSTPTDGAQIIFDTNNVIGVTKVENDFEDDVEAQAQGVQLGATYHTDGYIRIRTDEAPKKSRGTLVTNPSSGVITIPHGLTSTPTWIKFDFNDHRSLELREYLITKNATDIIITYTNPPAETTLTVWWEAEL